MVPWKAVKDPWYLYAVLFSSEWQWAINDKFYKGGKIAYFTRSTIKLWLSNPKLGITNSETEKKKKTMKHSTHAEKGTRLPKHHSVLKQSSLFSYPPFILYQMD